MVLPAIVYRVQCSADLLHHRSQSDLRKGSHSWPVLCVYPHLPPSICEGWVMAPYCPIKRKTPTTGFRVAVEKSASKTLNNRNPCVGVRSIHSRFHTRPVLFHRRTDANTQSHGAVNPPAQTAAPLPANRQRQQGRQGQARRTSLVDRMRVCARDS